MIEVTGDLFDGGYEAIGHGINCKGVQGAGIALQFKNRFPGQYRTYRTLCLRGELIPGGVQIWNEGGYCGFNIASQDEPGADAKISWLREGLIEAAQIAKAADIPTIAIPRIGCGIGGLTWPQVRDTILEVEHNVVDNYNGFEFTVVTLP